MNTLTEYAEAVKKAPPNERESLLKEIESFMSSSFVLSGIGKIPFKFLLLKSINKKPRKR
jgi:hypothetical protein